MDVEDSPEPRPYNLRTRTALSRNPTRLYDLLDLEYDNEEEEVEAAAIVMRESRPPLRIVIPVQPMDPQPDSSSALDAPLAVPTDDHPISSSMLSTQPVVATFAWKRIVNFINTFPPLLFRQLMLTRLQSTSNCWSEDTTMDMVRVILLQYDKSTVDECFSYRTFLRLTEPVFCVFLESIGKHLDLRPRIQLKSMPVTAKQSVKERIVGTYQVCDALQLLLSQDIPTRGFRTCRDMFPVPKDSPEHVVGHITDSQRFRTFLESVEHLVVSEGHIPLIVVLFSDDFVLSEHGRLYARSPTRTAIFIGNSDFSAQCHPQSHVTLNLLPSDISSLDFYRDTLVAELNELQSTTFEAYFFPTKKMEKFIVFPHAMIGDQPQQMLLCGLTGEGSTRRSRLSKNRIPLQGSAPRKPTFADAKDGAAIVRSYSLAPDLRYSTQRDHDMPPTTIKPPFIDLKRLGADYFWFFMICILHQWLLGIVKRLIGWMAIHQRRPFADHLNQTVAAMRGDFSDVPTRGTSRTKDIWYIRGVNNPPYRVFPKTGSSTSPLVGRDWLVLARYLPWIVDDFEFKDQETRSKTKKQPSSSTDRSSSASSTSHASSSSMDVDEPILNPAGDDEAPDGDEDTEDLPTTEDLPNIADPDLPTSKHSQEIKPLCVLISLITQQLFKKSASHAELDLFADRILQFQRLTQLIFDPKTTHQGKVRKNLITYSTTFPHWELFPYIPLAWKKMGPPSMLSAQRMESDHGKLRKPAKNSNNGVRGLDTILEDHMDMHVTDFILHAHGAESSSTAPAPSMPFSTRGHTKISIGAPVLQHLPYQILPKHVQSVYSLSWRYNEEDFQLYSRDSKMGSCTITYGTASYAVVGMYLVSPPDAPSYPFMNLCPLQAHVKSYTNRNLYMRFYVENIRAQRMWVKFSPETMALLPLVHMQSPKSGNKYASLDFETPPLQSTQPVARP